MLIFCAGMWMRVHPTCVHVHTHTEAREASSLFFLPLVSGLKLRSSGLGATTFTHWAILLASIFDYFYSKLLDKYLVVIHMNLNLDQTSTNKTNSGISEMLYIYLHRDPWTLCKISTRLYSLMPLYALWRNSTSHPTGSSDNNKDVVIEHLWRPYFVPNTLDMMCVR